MVIYLKGPKIIINTLENEDSYQDILDGTINHIRSFFAENSTLMTSFDAARTNITNIITTALQNSSFIETWNKTIIWISVVINIFLAQLFFFIDFLLLLFYDFFYPTVKSVHFIIVFSCERQLYNWLLDCSVNPIALIMINRVLKAVLMIPLHY